MLRIDTDGILLYVFFSHLIFFLVSRISEIHSCGYIVVVFILKCCKLSQDKLFTFELKTQQPPTVPYIETLGLM